MVTGIGLIMLYPEGDTQHYALKSYYRTGHLELQSPVVRQFPVQKQNTMKTNAQTVSLWKVGSVVKEENRGAAVEKRPPHHHQQCSRLSFKKIP